MCPVPEPPTVKLGGVGGLVQFWHDDRGNPHRVDGPAIVQPPDREPGMIMSWYMGNYRTRLVIPEGWSSGSGPQNTEYTNA